MAFDRWLLAAVVGLGLSLSASAPGRAAGDPHDPDWPCVQLKVPELTFATTWNGDQFDPLKMDWESDKEVQDLVLLLSQRRVSLEDAEKDVADFAAKAGPDKKDRLNKLFAGLFIRLNAERKDVMTGVVRFAKKQKAFAQELKKRNAEFDTFRADPASNFDEVQKRNDELLWDTRVFDDRQKSMTFVCEVPVIIEQRLFALGKAITEAQK